MSDHITPTFNEDPNGLFKLIFKTSLLSFITLGIYRFWATTRVRQYLWGSVTIDDDPLEYTGTGMEKLLGFLMAIIILAIYLGLVQFILTFVGLNFTITDDPEDALNQFISVFISAFAILPLVAFATYRARRYKMSRTLWRGIRFGMDKAALKFMLRWLFCSFLEVISLGIFTPYKTFTLEKYIADRSYFGSAKLEQGGTWTALYPAMKHVYIGLAITLAGAYLIYRETFVLGGIAIALGLVWYAIGIMNYRVKSFAYLTSHKTLDGAISLVSTPSAAYVIKKGISMTIALLLISSFIFGIIASLGYGFSNFNPMISVVILVVSYFIGMAMTEALGMAWITMPILEHYITSNDILGFDHIATIQQREADAGADAEGFADALDIGGAF